MQSNTFQFSFCLFPDKPDAERLTAKVTVSKDNCYIEYPQNQPYTTDVPPINDVQLPNEDIAPDVSSHVDVYSSDQDFNSFYLF